MGYFGLAGDLLALFAAVFFAAVLAAARTGAAVLAGDLDAFTPSALLAVAGALAVLAGVVLLWFVWSVGSDIWHLLRRKEWIGD